MAAFDYTISSLPANGEGGALDSGAIRYDNLAGSQVTGRAGVAESSLELFERPGFPLPPTTFYCFTQHLKRLIENEHSFAL
jgi:hypothetical protein